MADENFNIKVITTADTTGLRQTRAEMEALRQQAEKIRQDQGAAALFARVPPGGTPKVPGVGDGTTGLTGTAVGLGTIITLLTAGLNKWKEFNAEQDHWVDGMIKAEAQARALGEAILDIQDKARNAARVGTEPLEQSFIRLQQEIIRVRTEQGLLDLPSQGEAWKKLEAEAAAFQSQLNGVTSALQKESEAAKKAAQSELEKRVPGLAPEQIKEADAQTQRILQNEQAAAKARSEGREKDAEMFEKSAEQYKASATPQQLADLQRIHDLQDKLKPNIPAVPTAQPQPGQPGGGEEGTGGEPKFTTEQMRQHQLDAQSSRYQGVQQTRQDSNAAMQARLDEIATLQREMIGIWR